VCSFEKNYLREGERKRKREMIDLSGFKDEVYVVFLLGI